MRRTSSLIAFVLFAACAREPERAQDAGNDAVVPTQTPADREAAAGPGIAADQVTPEAAAEVVRRYFSLAAAGRDAEAQVLWWEGAEGADELAGLISGLEMVRAEVGTPGGLEGAAGSSYVDVPVLIEGRRPDRARFSGRGTITLRRVNDVPGSTAAQRRWRIYRLALGEEEGAVPGNRFVGRWAAETRLCRTTAWRFTADSLRTPAGSVCRFSRVTPVPGGYDIAARCTAEGPPTDDVLHLRFAESARALMFESRVIADSGLVRCPGE